MEVRGLIRTCIVSITDVLRHVSSLGALITVLALGIDPFAQQVASYQLEKFASSQNSTLPVRFYFPYDLDASFRDAAYAGLFGSGQNTLNPHCPSGNCTWAPYQTLALCSQCVDVTSLIKYSDPYVDQWSYFPSLPNGLSLQISNDVASSMSGTLPPMMLDKVGYAIVNFSLLDIGGPWAAECSLYWCVNTYTATLNNGKFAERLESSWYNATSSLAFVNTPSEDWSNQNLNLDIGKYYNTTPPTGGVKSQPSLNMSVDGMVDDSLEIDRRKDFLVSNTPEIQNWLGSLLSGNVTASRIPSTVVADLFNNDYEGRSPKNSISGFQDTFDQLAQSLTTWMRTSQGSASDSDLMGQAVGVIWTSETIVKVRWAWLALPCVLLAGTLVFLGFTIIGTRKQQMGIWKSSSLALLFHGLEERSAEDMEDLGHVAGMEEKSGRTWVRSVDKGEGARLVERSGLLSKNI